MPTSQSPTSLHKQKQHPEKGAPYSPELNPVENVWAFLRANKLSNRVFASYNAIVQACCNAWNWLTQQPDRITAIGTRSWAQVKA